MSVTKAVSEGKPKLDTGIKSHKDHKTPVKSSHNNKNSGSDGVKHEDSNSIMKVKITSKPKLDSGLATTPNKIRSSDSNTKSAVKSGSTSLGEAKSSHHGTNSNNNNSNNNNQNNNKKVTIADLSEEEKAKVYNIIEQLVTLTNEHESLLSQLTQEKEAYNTELTNLNTSFSNQLIPIEESMKRKDESIIALETKNHMILAMLALYQAKIKNMNDISHFFAANDADLQSRLTLLKNELDHVKGLNSALQQRIDNMETIAAANASVVTAATHKAHENSMKQLEARLQREVEQQTETQLKNVNLQNQLHQMQMQLDDAKSAVAAAAHSKSAAEKEAHRWRQVSETQKELTNSNSRKSHSAAAAPSAVLSNPYRNTTTNNNINTTASNNIDTTSPSNNTSATAAVPSSVLLSRDDILIGSGGQNLAVEITKKPRKPSVDLTNNNNNSSINNINYSQSGDVLVSRRKSMPSLGSSSDVVESLRVTDRNNNYNNINNNSNNGNNALDVLRGSVTSLLSSASAERGAAVATASGAVLLRSSVDSNNSNSNVLSVNSSDGNKRPKAKKSNSSSNNNNSRKMTKKAVSRVVSSRSTTLNYGSGGEGGLDAFQSGHTLSALFEKHQNNNNNNNNNNINSSSAGRPPVSSSHRVTSSTNNSNSGSVLKRVSSVGKTVKSSSSSSSYNNNNNNNSTTSTTVSSLSVRGAAAAGVGVVDYDLKLFDVLGSLE